MTIYLKQSTASQEIPLGIFVDSTDGNTAETGLTIANTDIQLWKTGATTLASKNSGGATHISGGIYYAVLDATDTDTLGPLVIFVHVSGALSVRLECVVLAANVYDSMIGATANLAVDSVAISGDTTAADNLELAADGTGYNLGAGQIVAASVTGAVGSVTGNVGGNLGGNVVGSVGSVTGSVGSVTGNVGGSVASVTGNVGGNVVGSVASVSGAVGSVTGSIGSLAAQAKSDVNAEVVDVLRTDTIPDSYSTDGDQPTIAQGILEIRQFLQERLVSGTTVTVKKPNGTEAMTFTLDDATTPTSITRAS